MPLGSLRHVQYSRERTDTCNLFGWLPSTLLFFLTINMKVIFYKYESYVRYIKDIVLKKQGRKSKVHFEGLRMHISRGTALNSFITSAWSLHIPHQQAHQIETLSQAGIRGNYPGLSPFPPPCSPTICFTVIPIPWSRKWQPTLVFLPGKSHGQRSLVGYAWSHKESDTTEHHHHYHHLHLMGLQAWL